MKNFHYSAVGFEEIETRRTDWPFFFRIVLQHFIYFKPQREDNFFLVDEFKVRPLIIHSKFHIPLINFIELFNKQLGRDGEELAGAFFANVFRHQAGDETDASILDLRGHPRSSYLILVQILLQRRADG